MNKQRNSDDRFRPIFSPNYTGVFSQLNCFYWCMKFIDGSWLVGTEARYTHIVSVYSVRFGEKKLLH